MTIVLVLWTSCIPISFANNNTDKKILVQDRQHFQTTSNNNNEDNHDGMNDVADSKPTNITGTPILQPQSNHFVNRTQLLINSAFVDCIRDPQCSVEERFDLSQIPKCPDVNRTDICMDKNNEVIFKP